MASFKRALEKVIQKFQLTGFNDHQKAAIRSIVQDNVDLFINLPTGFGKSLVFQALPLVFDELRKEQGHIVIVVSPLINLIRDQVSYLRKIGLTAINISESEEEREDLEKGKFQVVYGTPEAWLLNERWRSMLRNSPYSTKICAIAVDEAHVIKQWGLSTKTSLAPFRECYSRLHEFRTLVPSCPIVALTATATKATKSAIFDVLMMKNVKEIFESPNKKNLAFSVVYMETNRDLESYFDWLVEEMKEKKKHCGRTIIYCQTIRQCSLIYATLKGMLGKDMYIEIDNPKTAILEMLHSCTPSSNKENILSSFAEDKGAVRVLIATIAFGMGVNCKGVSRVVHFGPSKNIESYIQETGRAGRDGSQSVAFLLYNGAMLAHVESDIKSYVMKDQCRRLAILKYFENNLSENPRELHLCCDYCAKNCKCGLLECGQFTTFPTMSANRIPNLSGDGNQRSRVISQHKRELVQQKLIIYYKTILKQLLSTTANTDLKTLTAIPFVLGFSETQIHQVLENLEQLFSLQDICNVVEIWDIQHAHKILSILKEEFQDTEDLTELENDFEFDDLFQEDWETVIEDNELFEMALNNLSVSELQDSFTEQAPELNVSDSGIPQAVIDTLEKVLCK